MGEGYHVGSRWRLEEEESKGEEVLGVLGGVLTSYSGPTQKRRRPLIIVSPK
jgi:hypothetical protein